MSLDDILKSYAHYLKPRNMDKACRRISIWFLANPRITKKNIPKRNDLRQSIQNVLKGSNPGTDDIRIDGGTIIFRLGRFDDANSVYYSQSNQAIYFLQDIPRSVDDVESMITLNKELPSHISLRFEILDDIQSIQNPHYTTYFVSKGSSIGSRRGYASNMHDFELPADFQQKAHDARREVHRALHTTVSQDALDTITIFVGNVRKHMAETVSEMSGGAAEDSDNEDEIPEQLLDLIATYIADPISFSGMQVFLFDEDFLAVVNTEFDTSFICSKDRYVTGPAWLHAPLNPVPHENADEVFQALTELYDSDTRESTPEPKRPRFEIPLRRGGAAHTASIALGLLVLAVTSIV
nr:hypothetical protein TetV2_00584 [Oceanusvirus sp.]